MKKALLLLVIVLGMGLQLYSINQMDLIQTMSGEFAGSEFGYSMASIDFNADGYDDLVVSSSAWNPNGVYHEQNLYGKLYFYWGGPSFDNVPDMIIPGTHYGHYYGLGLFNAGDINGDGFADLIISNRDSSNISTEEIFYSRTNPQIIPDVVLEYPLTLTEGVYAFPLGDINGDNHADLGLSFTGELDRHGRRLLILTDIDEQPTVFYETDNYQGSPLLSGVGDVNNDGYDDFFMHTPIYGLGNTDMRLMLYYGDSNFPLIDSLTISNNTHAVVTDWGNPVGDVNGDGIDDFVAYNYHLWLGNNNLTANWNMTLNTEYGYSESGDSYPFQYGDFNNDGFDDIIGTNHGYGYWSGVANIWLGGSQMNGNLDLHIFPPVNYQNCNYGWAKAVGDFNADGFDDIAVSAPWWAQHSDHNQTGKVFVYAGNANLSDTTPADDPIMPEPVVSNWDVLISPDPITKRSLSLNIKLTGAGYKNAQKLHLGVFDIKGRVIISKPISANDLKSGNVNLILKSFTPGTYIVEISDNNNISLITRKTTIK